MAKQLIRACLLLLVGALAIQAQGEIKDGSYQGEAAIDGDKYSVTLSVKTVSAGRKELKVFYGGSYNCGALLEMVSTNSTASLFRETALPAGTAGKTSCASDIQGFVRLQAKDGKLAFAWGGDRAEAEAGSAPTLLAKVDAAGQAAMPAVTANNKPAATPAAVSNCPGSGLTDAEVKEILRLHNKARAAVNVAPLTWNCTLADYAQKWADGGKLGHSKREQRANLIPNSFVGENITAQSNAGWSIFASGLDWETEKPDWNNATRMCKAGAVCGHYTQMVWRNTTEIGCGITRKAPGDFSLILVCNYNPAGNDGGPAY